ncbi:MAG: NAD(P)H-quinone oxidoreductase [Acidimicrobiaceae bacterium]|nr:NAD(P)H-quinone oxidoreductase [Acidimicrobiaceae bacterium]MYE75423.1 NAD(P)H-quinone oxidoreductase [Acidimicrobiaceae bacterium]MYI54997.1 NAD(P)H-quinone oxidoreductase [Acidimicrobiaceae bacterium]
MRAVVLTAHGGPEVLKVQDVPDPVPGPAEILVDVVTSAVNRADLMQRRGLYPGPPAEHEIPGLEFAGRVAALGERVAGHAVGDPVMGIVAGGGYAERVVVHHRQAMAVPDALGLDAAGAFPEVYITAWDALVRQGGLTTGRWALVHAGASGVGTASIQIAKAMGARIAVTASAGKHHVCEALGADLVIDYASDDFVEAVKSAAGGTGVDVVLDVIGGDYLPRNIDCLRTNGRIVQVGVMSGTPVPFNPMALMAKRAALIGTTLRARPIEEKIAVTRQFAAEMLPHVAAGAMAPVIDSRFPLAEAPAAHERMEANLNAGKIVLDVKPA